MKHEKSKEKEKTQEQLFHELSCYTTSRQDHLFIHEHAVDAFTAQNALENTKPITITFALVGLYLMLEENFSGIGV